LGERLIFHSSLGFAIIAGWLLYRGAQRLGAPAVGYKALAGIMALLVVVSAAIAIPRNADWKNDGTLFAADIKVTPNSVLVMANVAAAVISKADYETDEKKKAEQLHYAVDLLDRAIELHQHTFVAGFLNRGIAWFKLGDIDKCKANMDTVAALYPNYPTLKGMYALLSDHYMRKGWDSYGQFGKFPEAILEFKKGLSFDSTNGMLWYNLGGAYFSNHQPAEAITAWQHSLRYKPDNPQAQAGMQAAMQMIQQMQGAPPRKK
jgi:tetratricopeptide (TPR) repeat protein